MLNSSSQWGSLLCWPVHAEVGELMWCSVCSSLPQVSFPQGPFTSPRCLSCVYAPPHPAPCLPQTALQFQALWAHHWPSLHLWKFASTEEVTAHHPSLQRAEPSSSWSLYALLPAGRTSRQASQDTVGWNGRSSNQECHRFSFFSLQVQRHYTFQSFMQLAFGQSPEYWNGCFRKAM